MKLCAIGFISIVAALIGFSGLASFDDQYWKVALASQQPLSDPPAPAPSHFTLSGNGPDSVRKRSELSFDALGLIGISLFITGIILHLRYKHAASISK